MSNADAIVATVGVPVKSGAITGTVEHPVETARRALLEAAAVEGPRWAHALTQMAEALPPRSSLHFGPKGPA